MNEIDPSYLNQIQKYPLLSAEEELELSKEIEKGNKAAINKMINSNLRLVVSIVHKFNTGNNISVMDLIQEGNMGLMVAAEKFSYSYKTRFSTYAYPWIIQYMLRFCNNRSSIISLPHRKEELIRKIQNAQTYLFQQNGREATSTELALYLGITEEKLNEGLSYSYTVTSLDIDASDDENSCTIGDMQADTRFNPEEILMKEENKKEIRAALKLLSPNEQKVIWYRYNFNNDTDRKPLREISKMIGVSPEAVRQTELRAVKHMKENLKKQAMQA